MFVAPGGFGDPPLERFRGHNFGGFGEPHTLGPIKAGAVVNLVSLWLSSVQCNAKY